MTFTRYDSGELDVDYDLIMLLCFSSPLIELHCCCNTIISSWWLINILLFIIILASETCNDFHPMFFTHDKSFEEFFCICIQLLNKTWKEMRATSEDFNKARFLGEGHILKYTPPSFPCFISLFGPLLKLILMSLRRGTHALFLSWDCHLEMHIQISHLWKHLNLKIFLRMKTTYVLEGLKAIFFLPGLVSVDSRRETKENAFKRSEVPCVHFHSEIVQSPEKTVPHVLLTVWVGF